MRSVWLTCHHRITVIGSGPDRHAAIIRNCRRFLGEQPSLAATRKWQTRFVLLDLLYGLCWTAILLHPAGLDVVSNTMMMFLMLLVVAVSSMSGVCSVSLRHLLG